MTEAKQDALVRSLIRDAVTVCMAVSRVEYELCRGLDFIDDFDDIFQTVYDWPPQKWAELFVGVGRAPSERLRHLVLHGLKQRLAVMGGVDG